jgi:acetyl-CoA carboxylase carboxyl transferase subunit alpha
MLLDFEKPIVELEDKIADMKSLAQQNGVDVTDALASLKEKLQKLKEETYSNLTRWQRVQLSRHQDRPYTLDYIYEITDDFIEMHGDRSVADDKAMVGGFGSVDGQTIMFVGQQKGRNTKQRQERNFGMANPEGYRKSTSIIQAGRKIQQANHHTD